jgi:hypothetical protein
MRPAKTGVLLLFVVLACIAILALDAGLAFAEAYTKISVAYTERKRWYDAHGADSTEFSFLADVIKETREILAVGPLLAAFAYSLRNNAATAFASNVSSFLGKFFLAQMLFPTTAAQKALLVAAIGVVGWIFLSYLSHLKKLEIFGRAQKRMAERASRDFVEVD